MNEPAARITLVTIGVRDLAHSTAFYESLGFRRRAKNAEGVSFFEAGSVILSLWSNEELARDANISPIEPSRFRGVSLAWNVASAAEVDAVLARAKTAGATILRAAQTVFWGGYTAVFADPDGHLWEVAYNPDFPLSADGKLTLPD